jgi:hypothetical protein
LRICGSEYASGSGTLILRYGWISAILGTTAAAWDDSNLENFCDGRKVSNSRDAFILVTPVTTVTEGKQTTEKRPYDIRNASNN